VAYSISLPVYIRLVLESQKSSTNHLLEQHIPAHGPSAAVAVAVAVAVATAVAVAIAAAIAAADAIVRELKASPQTVTCIRNPMEDGSMRTAAVAF
jgi:hypothetical protein